MSAIPIPSWRRRWLAAWGVALLGGAAALALAQAAWVGLPHPRPLEELSYYPSGTALRPATLGHPEAVADLAWLRAVQYYGEHRQTDGRFQRMGHVFDILTSLSPHFAPAYVFGAFALAQEGFDFPAAERLILRGIEANPRDGALAFQAGFLYYVKPGGRDLARAAEYFQQAARQPNAPPHAARFAAFSRQNRGDLGLALQLWQEVLDTSPNEYLRQIAERQIQRIRESIAAGRPDQAVLKLATPRVIVLPKP